MLDLYKMMKYFDPGYNGSQAVKELRKAPKTVTVVFIRGSEDEIAEKWSLCECLDKEQDYSKPACGKDRFNQGLDHWVKNFKVYEIVIPQVMLFLKDNMEIMENYIDFLLNIKPADYVFFVFYTNAGTKEDSLEPVLKRFLLIINKSNLRAKILGYEINIVERSRIKTTKGKLYKINES